MRKTKYVEYLTFYILNKLAWRLEKELTQIQFDNPNPQYFMALAKAHHAVTELRQYY
tara:strand:+ start:1229 stop:1399 length:171 start_codon:yes stop_codon:yes gene_type:complete